MYGKGGIRHIRPFNDHHQGSRFSLSLFTGVNFCCRFIIPNIPPYFLCSEIQIQPCSILFSSFFLAVWSHLFSAPRLTFLLPGKLVCSLQPNILENVSPRNPSGWHPLILFAGVFACCFSIGIRARSLNFIAVIVISSWIWLCTHTHTHRHTSKAFGELISLCAFC